MHIQTNNHIISLEIYFYFIFNLMKTGRRAHRGHSTPTEAFKSTTNTRTRVQPQITLFVGALNSVNFG